MLPAIKMSKALETYGLRQRQAWLKRVTLWVGLLCITAHASATIHLLLVAHVYCPVSGEIVHADDGHAQGQVQLVVANAQDSVRDSSPEKGHDKAEADCQVCSERRKDSHLFISAQRTNTFIEITHRFHSERHLELSLADTYRSAPKNSPPA